MGEKSELQQAIDQIQGEINERMRALDVLVRAQTTAKKGKRQPRKTKGPSLEVEP